MEYWDESNHKFTTERHCSEILFEGVYKKTGYEFITNVIHEGIPYPMQRKEYSVDCVSGKSVRKNSAIKYV